MLIAAFFVKAKNWKGFPGGCRTPAMQETRSSPWVRKIPWRRKWQSIPVFLPGKSQRQRSLVGYSPWPCKRVGHNFAIKQLETTLMTIYRWTGKQNMVHPCNGILLNKKKRKEMNLINEHFEKKTSKTSYWMKWHRQKKVCTVYDFIHTKNSRASLVVQWLRIRLPMQETWVPSLVWEDSTCCGATKPVCCNYWACSLEPRSRNKWALVPQLVKSSCPTACAPQ